MAAYRQTVSAGGISEDDEGGSWGGVWAMLKDPFSHMFAFIHFSIIIAQSYKDFFPSVSPTRRRYLLRKFRRGQEHWLIHPSLDPFNTGL